MSRACDSARRWRFIAVYARRPKVCVPSQQSITVKFNGLLFETADALSSVGIPTFAGVPRVSTVLGLRLNTECSWFRISPKSEPAPDIERSVAVSEDRTNDSVQNDGVIGPMSKGKILEIVRDECRPMHWEEAILVIRHTRSNPQAQSGYPFFSGYKPFYFGLGSRDS